MYIPKYYIESEVRKSLYVLSLEIRFPWSFFQLFTLENVANKFTGFKGWPHRNLKSRSRIKPWKVKKDSGKTIFVFNEYCAMNNCGGEIQFIHNVKWGAHMYVHTFGTLHQMFYFYTSRF
jgi:hypothetical protein